MSCDIIVCTESPKKLPKKINLKLLSMYSKVSRCKVSIEKSTDFLRKIRILNKKPFTIATKNKILKYKSNKII